MALKGNIRSLQALRRAVSKLPLTAATRIAAQAAPEVSALTREAFDSEITVYGSPRPRSVDGDKPLTLVRTGASRDALRFVAEGSRMRTATLPKYTKYLIGLYSVLPNGPLPAIWRERLNEIAAQVLHEQIFGAGGD